MAAPLKPSSHTSVAPSRMTEGLFSSRTDEWATPQALFDALDAEFHFTLDPCATPENAKCKQYFTREQNGLVQSWADEVVFMNPPYGRGIELWMQRAVYSWAHDGATVVCLVHARTDTRWWHDYAMQASEIRFIRGRVKFEGDGAVSTCPFPSVILVYDGVWARSYPYCSSWTHLEERDPS